MVDLQAVLLYKVLLLSPAASPGEFGVGGGWGGVGVGEGVGCANCTFRSKSLTI